MRPGKHTHNGGVPFGYEFCWTLDDKGKRKKSRCQPEHPAGMHVHQTEGPVVSEMFRRYGSGGTMLSQLTVFLNEDVFVRVSTIKQPMHSEENSVADPCFGDSRLVMYNWLMQRVT